MLKTIVNAQNYHMNAKNKEASWLYAELFVNDKTLKNVNDQE